MVSGFMAEECSALLSEFFAKLRRIRNEKKEETR
jgi:hypothetical protein